MPTDRCAKWRPPASGPKTLIPLALAHLRQLRQKFFYFSHSQSLPVPKTQSSVFGVFRKCKKFRRIWRKSLTPTVQRL